MKKKTLKTSKVNLCLTGHWTMAATMQGGGGFPLTLCLGSLVSNCGLVGDSHRLGKGSVFSFPPASLQRAEGLCQAAEREEAAIQHKKNL